MTMKANAAMTRHVVCVEADDTLLEAHEIMSEWNIRHLPVLEDRKLIGILSDRDVLARSEWDDGKLVVPEVDVSDAMTCDPVTCSPSSDLSDIGTMMVDRKIDCVPVVDEDGVLVGLVTSTDLIEQLITKEYDHLRRPIPLHYHIHAGARPGLCATVKV